MSVCRFECVCVIEREREWVCECKCVFGKSSCDFCVFVGERDRRRESQ